MNMNLTRPHASPRVPTPNGDASPSPSRGTRHGDTGRNASPTQRMGTRHDQDVTPPCAEFDPDLWFADHPQHRRLAADYCRTCPLIEECLTEAERLRAIPRPITGPGFEPFGVWAARWYDGNGKPGRTLGTASSLDCCPATNPPTKAAYDRHRRSNTEPCLQSQLDSNAYTRARRRAAA